MIDRTVQEILDELTEHGTMPTPDEAMALCEATLEGERSMAMVSALDRTLRDKGWVIMDVTTDDSDGTAIELVPPEDKTAELVAAERERCAQVAAWIELANSEDDTTRCDIANFLRRGVSLCPKCLALKGTATSYYMTCELDGCRGDE